MKKRYFPSFANTQLESSAFCRMFLSYVYQLFLVEQDLSESTLFGSKKLVCLSGLWQHTSSPGFSFDNERVKCPCTITYFKSCLFSVCLYSYIPA